MESDDYFPELLLQLTSHNQITDFAAAFSIAFILLCLVTILSAAERTISALSQEEMDKAEEGHSASDKIIIYLSDHLGLMKASCGMVYPVIIIIVNVLCIYGISILNRTAYPLVFLISAACTIILWILFYGIAPGFLVKHKRSIARLAAPLLMGITKTGAPFLRMTSMQKDSLDNETYRKKQAPLVNEAPNDMYEEKEMLEEIIHFYNKKANEIMTPRTDIEAIEVKMTSKML